MPIQKNVIAQEDTNKHVIVQSKGIWFLNKYVIINKKKKIYFFFLEDDDIFSSEDDQNVFSNKSNNLFGKGKNLFSDEISSNLWKDTPARSVNKNIIPASIDLPPPLSNTCKFIIGESLWTTKLKKNKNLYIYVLAPAPKSTIDDLFGDPDDSEDSDDIFSNKSSKNIFASDREIMRSDSTKQQIIENVQSKITSEKKSDGLFEDDEDIFEISAKGVKSSDNYSGSTKKVI